MGAAMKKHLQKMEISRGDLVVLIPPLGGRPDEYMPFGADIAAALREMGLGPLIILPPLVELKTMSQEQLSELGLCRVIPEISPATGTFNWEAYEDEAHQLVRLAFKVARERVEGKADAQDSPRQADSVHDQSALVEGV